MRVFHGVHDLLMGNRFPEEIIYEPLLSLEDSSIRRKFSDLIKLKVIPAGEKDPSILSNEPLDLVLLRLRSLESYLSALGVGILIVDLPSSCMLSRPLIKAVSRWLDLLIPSFL